MDDKRYFIGADILRIISGFGVVLIHVTDPFLVYPPYAGVGGLEWWIVNLINSSFRFSVPVFLMLSGFLLLDPARTESFQEFYRKRFLRVGLPFLFWVSFYFVWLFLLGRPLAGEAILLSLLTVNLDHLYFLFIIVELYFISPLLITFNRGTSRFSHTVFAVSASLFTILLATSGAFFPDAYVATSKNAFSIFIPFISYFYLGNYLRNVRISPAVSIWLINIFLNLVLITTLLSDGVVTSFVRQYGSPTIFLMSCIVFLLGIGTSFWERLFSHKRLIGIIRNFSSTIFGIYLVHMIVITSLDYLFPLEPGEILTPIWMWVVVKVGITFFASYLIVVLGKKIPRIGLLFG